MKPEYISNFTVWLEFNGKYLIGEKESKILEEININGSFMGAVKALGVSYAYAWNSVDKISKQLGKPIVEAIRGGELGGGGAKLTKMGHFLLRKYKILEKKVEKSVSLSSIEDKKRVYLFKNHLQNADLIIIGSQCVGINILIELMLKNLKFISEIISVGSLGGLSALMLGEADIAGIHLLDESTKEYNLSFLRRYHLEDKCIILRGYLREQGFLISKENPKKIKGIEDLLRKDVKFVNRCLGSGTRDIIDREMQKLANKTDKKVEEITDQIKGYKMQLKSHTSVAKAILLKKADVGIGIKAMSEKYYLDFIPLTVENFDFVVDKERLNKPIIKSFINMLGSKKFKRELKGRKLGIKTVKDTGKIIYNP